MALTEDDIRRIGREEIERARETGDADFPKRVADEPAPAPEPLGIDLSNFALMY